MPPQTHTSRSNTVRYLTPTTVARLAARFENQSPQALLRWALERWHQDLILCTSFQAEGMVLFDMAWRIDPSVRVATLDTGRLPQETHDLIDRVRDRYGVSVATFHPDARALDPLLDRIGSNGFYRSIEARIACCHARKVEPLTRALAQAGAWIAGLRRGQSPQRANIAKIAHDPAHGHSDAGGIAKISPLASWDWQQVWDYIEIHDVPYHTLYDQGYTSIGCAPCTRAVRPGVDPRAGRWWWEQGSSKECGLHQTSSKPPSSPLAVLEGGRR